MSVIAFSPKIGPVSIDCFLSEKHDSDLEITANPVENGAEVHDHAVVKPKRLTLEIADENGAQAYQSLVRFQESRVPFTIVSGLTYYKDMLVKSITADRDSQFSRVLYARIELQEVVIVSTAYAAVDVDQAGQTSPNSPAGQAGDATTADRTAGTVQRGDAPASQVAPQRQRSLAVRALNQ